MLHREIRQGRGPATEVAMAGPMTHMLISQVASDPTVVTTLDPKLQDILIDRQRFLLLGSVGPDLPAVVDALTSDHVSDRMHDGNLPTRVPTNTTIRELYRKLKAGPIDTAVLAFLLGYEAHCDADRFVHPIVNAISGGDMMVHRHAETVQDAAVFYDYTQQDIKTSDYLSWLALCEEQPRELAAVFAAWQPIVDKYYGQHSCRVWFDSYKTAFTIAREIKYHAGWSYPRVLQIADADLRRFYSRVPLPVSNTTGHFYKDVFQRAVSYIAQLWQQIYLRLIDPADNDILDLCDDGDLNDGRNVRTGQTFYLWR
ncbi:MAG: hypothetical protein E6J91_44725 [Deltaproteobacteria bacterium]|nr:MAG: hypothetical protein E6J91_44725 [Deltaproteobacteria bacterium]